MGSKYPAKAPTAAAKVYSVGMAAVNATPKGEKPSNIRERDIKKAVIKMVVCIERERLPFIKVCFTGFLRLAEAAGDAIKHHTPDDKF
jgi:hypothetical protein